MASVKSVKKVCVSVYRRMHVGQKLTLVGRHPARRVDYYDEIPLVCKRCSGSTSSTADHPTLPMGLETLFPAYVLQDCRGQTCLRE